MSEENLDDRLDRLVADYADLLAAGKPVDRNAALTAVPADARPGLERCLKMIEAGTARAPAGRALVPGLAFGRYELVRELGRGGMALVWLARDVELRRPVALKVLRPGLAFEPRHVDRFRREALAIAKLNHPHIVQIFDVGEACGHPYLAMEFVEGPSLASVIAALGRGGRESSAELARACGVPALARAEQSFEEALCRLLAPLADALHAAHESGLVHRDVKPSNILLRADGRAVIADFGLAKDDRDPALSLTGDPLGTPYYMSPEQAWLSEVEVDRRTDVYSLGVTLYEALSGVRPFEGRTVLEVFERIKTTVPPGLHSVAPRSSRDAAAVVRRAMARDPRQRYASALELHADLQALAERRATRARSAEGGGLQRFWTQLRLTTAGLPYEYRSSGTFLGLPLVHVFVGPRRPGTRRVAKGWFAVGDVAIGGLACGGVACGALAFGGLGLGLLCGSGGLATGLLAFGGLALGGFPIGGLAAGWLAFGGVALGYGAIGGLAYGVYAGGGSAHGKHVIDHGLRDPEAARFFAEFAPWALEFLERAAGRGG